METKGRHLLCDLWLDQSVDEKLTQKFTKVIEENLTVMHRSHYKFDPHGETIAYILAESHFTVHTYPEHKYLSLDIYICTDDVDLEMILEKMLTGVKVKKLAKKIIPRGVEAHTL